MDAPSISVVTVVYSKELPLLRLQARSLGIHFKYIKPEKIIVCVNDFNEKRVIEEVEALRYEYGEFSDRLTVLGGDDIFSLHPNRGICISKVRKFLARNLQRLLRPQAGWRNNNGWNMQQAFKLAAARHCQSEYLILLDAKNIFIRAVDWTDFIDDTGRPRSSFSGPNKLHLRWYFSSARTIGNKKNIPPKEFTSFVTPFCLRRQWACEILDLLDVRKLPVEYVFSRPRNRATEFMMINAWMHMQGASVRDFFAKRRLRSYTVFQGMNKNLAARILIEAFDERAKCIGLHSGAMSDLGQDNSQLVCKHLVNGLIVSSLEQALELLTDSRSSTENRQSSPRVVALSRPEA